MSEQPTFLSELRRARKRTRISQAELAARLGYSPTMLQRIEEGTRPVPEGFVEQYQSAVVEITRERHEDALAAAGVAP